jgi:TRAP transporter TAXI family solute receptor
MGGERMKKLLSVVMTGVVAMSALTACGSSQSTTATSAAGATAETSAAAAGSGTGSGEEVVFGTGGTTGTYYAVGGVMATVLNPLMKNSHLTVTSTGASKANIQLIDDGDANLAIVQNDVMSYAHEGTDLFADEGAYETFAPVAGLYDETVQIITCTDDIKTVADLKGKTVSVGDAGSGVEFNARQILDAYGISFDDIKVVNASFGDSADSLKDEKIDAAFIVAGAPTTAVVDLSTTKAVHLVELDDDHIKTLQDKYSFYTPTTIPGGTYTGVDADAKTVSVRATIIASTKLSEDVVYEMLKAMFDNKDALAAGHAKFELLNLEDATKGITIPFHPGAKKYYEEQGITVD